MDPTYVSISRFRVRNAYIPKGLKLDAAATELRGFRYVAS